MERLKNRSIYTPVKLIQLNYQMDLMGVTIAAGATAY